MSTVYSVLRANELRHLHVLGQDVGVVQVDYTKTGEAFPDGCGANVGDQ